MPAEYAARNRCTEGTLISLATAGRVVPLALMLVACSGAPASPTPTPTSAPTPTAARTATPVPAPVDSGPVDAVTSAFDAALAGNLPRQLDFLACVAGGSEALQFSSLFGVLAELALASSGVDPQRYWDAFGATMTDFNATETSRSGDSAIVHVSLRLTVTPDVATLRQMMRDASTGRGRPADGAAINAILDRFLGRLDVEHNVDSDLTVTRVDGAWRACAAE